MTGGSAPGTSASAPAHAVPVNDERTSYDVWGAAIALQAALAHAARPRPDLHLGADRRRLLLAEVGAVRAGGAAGDPARGAPGPAGATTSDMRALALHAAASGWIAAVLVAVYALAGGGTFWPLWAVATLALALRRPRDRRRRAAEPAPAGAPARGPRRRAHAHPRGRPRRPGGRAAAHRARPARRRPGAPRRPEHAARPRRGAPRGPARGRRARAQRTRGGGCGHRRAARPRPRHRAAGAGRPRPGGRGRGAGAPRADPGHRERVDHAPAVCRWWRPPPTSWWPRR